MATGLDPARYRAVVVLAEDGELGGDLRGAGVEVLVRPLAVLRRALMAPVGLARVGATLAADAGALRRTIAEHDAALVHTNTSVTLGGAAAARMAGVPHVWHVREIYAGFERLWPAYRRMLRTAAALPCVSEATRAQLGDAPQARVLHDGLAVAPDRAPRAGARAALDLPADAFVVAVLGRISPWKGQDVVLRALADESLAAGAGGASPPVVALVAGDPWHGEEQRLERPARPRRPPRRRRPGAVRGLPRRRRPTSTARPTWSPSPPRSPIPLPNSALEAAAAGCCVVAAAHGGLPEILRDGATGRLVAPGDPAALAGALAELRADPAAARAPRRRGGRGRPRALRPRALLRRVQALYDELL